MIDSARSKLQRRPRFVPPLNLRELPSYVSSSDEEEEIASESKKPDLNSHDKADGILSSQPIDG